MNYPQWGFAVPIWFDHWGTYGSPPTYANWGHVALWLGDGRVLTSPLLYKELDAKGVGNPIYPSIDAMMKTLGGGAKYLGWSEYMNGKQIVKAGALAAHERQADPSLPVKRRAEPTTKSKDLGSPISAGEVGEFDGWARGETVSGNNIWFRGLHSKNWFWSGGFTSQSTKGLTDLNPKPDPSPTPTQRVVDPKLPVRIRATASTKGKELGEYAANTKVTVQGWVNGDLVSGIKVWFKTDKGYAWAGGFTSQSTSGLKDLNVQPPKPDPNPPKPDPKPEPEYVPFKAFSSVVTKVEPAHTNNYEVGRFPAEQTEVVLHDFGTDGKDTFSGTVSWFKNAKADASAHFVVSGDEIVQMVSLSDRAYHAGPEGNNRVGIELDPAVGRAKGDPLRDKTIASAKRLLKALNDHYKRELRKRKHPEFMQTQCGDDVNLSDYDLTEKPVDPSPGVDPEAIWENTKAVNELNNSIVKLNGLLEAIFKVS